MTEQTSPELPLNAQLAVAAARSAVRKLMIEAKAKGTKLVFYRDGKVVETLIDEIPPLDERDIPPPYPPLGSDSRENGR